MDLSYKNLEIIAETIQKEIKCSWLSHYFKFGVEDGKTICIISNCYIDIFQGINYLKDHLAQKHNIFGPTDNTNINADGQCTDAHSQVAKYTQKSWSFRNKIVWQYFTAEEWPFAKCNICNNNINTGSIKHLETHLLFEHLDAVEKIQDEIKSTWLSQYFKFDVERRKTTCIVNNCSINIFGGIKYLKNHLFKKHNIVESNDNTNINVDGQQVDAHLQAAKRSWSFYYTIAWQYFTVEEWPSAKCNICNNRYTSGVISSLERHLSLKHPETVEKIRDEIKSMWLSQYFIFDIEHGKTTCIVENCSVNVFRGINCLEDHLYKKHNITNVYVDAEQIGAHSQIAKHPKKLWSLRYKKVWRHFTSEEWPLSKCNICDNRFYGGLITKLENHLLCKHPEVIEKMRDEIKSTWLSQYFKFDMEYRKITCIVENCSVNIFRGKRYLKHHLFKRHNIVKPNDNASINADVQRADIHSQAAKYAKKSWNSSNNIIRQYFTLKEWPFTKCNICDNYFYSGLMTQLENHLLRKHPEVIKKIQDELKSTWLSQYFILDVECGKTTCIVENCNVNIFLGVNYLKDHLSKKHNLFEPNNGTYVNVNGQCAGAHAEGNPE
ncbi:uncharacterized protein LOC105830187 [Monomorium pharaonis]|uniref:uncharacterized protein LOC105830187 n=1 Tax=Monomorium pharaonis TaxID=307658 RepID=UPI00063F321D|nr:uncharacterized protein LOC105830187 [Monomorium pharaonis]